MVNSLLTSGKNKRTSPIAHSFLLGMLVLSVVILGLFLAYWPNEEKSSVNPWI